MVMLWLHGTNGIWWSLWRCCGCMIRMVFGGHCGCMVLMVFGGHCGDVVVA